MSFAHTSFAPFFPDKTFASPAPEAPLSVPYKILAFSNSLNRRTAFTGAFLLLLPQYFFSSDFNWTSLSLLDLRFKNIQRTDRIEVDVYVFFTFFFFFPLMDSRPNQTQPRHLLERSLTPKAGRLADFPENSFWYLSFISFSFVHRNTSASGLGFHFLTTATVKVRPVGYFPCLTLLPFLSSDESSSLAFSRYH